VVFRSPDKDPPRRVGRSALKACVLCCALLVLATLATYRSVSHFSFVGYDDPDYVSENSHVQGGLSWHTLAWAMTATDASNWHPLTWLSHALDVELFGLGPAGHHLTSLLIHVLNTLLLFLLLWHATGARWRSFLVAALFALHPLNVESVAWIAERKNVLSTFFFLLTLGCYGWYALRPGMKRYLAVAGTFALGLAAKPMVVTLPCVLVLLDAWPLRRIEGWSAPSEAFPATQRSLRTLIWEKLPLLALSAGCAVITVVAQGSDMYPFRYFPLTARLENAVCSYELYLWKAIWPAGLAVMYPFPASGLGIWKPTVAALGLIATSGLVWRQRKQRPYLLAGWFWLLGTLVPVIGIIQVGAQAMADRYAYVPMIGLFVVLVWGVAEVANLRAIPLGWRIGVATAVLAALALLTYRQAGFWKTSYDLWAHTLAVTHDNDVAEENLGIALQEQGRWEEALQHFRNGTRISPQDPVLHSNLAATLGQTGRLEEALAEYEVVIRLAAHDPSVLAVAYADRGTVYRKLGDRQRAQESYLMALQIDPQETGAQTGLRMLEEGPPTAPR